jgi:hypothetical protein
MEQELASPLGNAIDFMTSQRIAAISTRDWGAVVHSVISAGLLLLTVAAPASKKTDDTVCVKLSKDFDSNERLFAIIHDTNSTLLKSAEQYQATMAPFEQQVALAEARLRAIGGTPSPSHYSGPSAAEKVAEARATLEKDDAKFKAEGDRITTLLIANKCSPPNHVTGWFTYSETNPNATK